MLLGVGGLLRREESFLHIKGRGIPHGTLC